MARPLPQPARIYEVGGAVRDALLGRPNADRDYVVVGVTPETMLASGFRPVGRDFPVFLHPETNEEYALARTERKHGRGYRGFEFFASPDVTLEEDLARRDLTINAMARGDDGRIIDPHAGQLDLAARVLRHVSPAFVEDPLRVLRVARFAARLGFAVAPETEALMRSIVASGELSTLAPERVWQELAKGLVETRPSQMLAVLRQCGALAKLLPEVDATFGMARMQSPPDGVVGAGVSGASVPDANVPDAVVPNAVVPNAAVPDAGVLTSRALDWAADHGATLAARYAILLHDLSATNVAQASQRLPLASTLRSIRLAERVSARLKVPLECQDAARLAAQLWRKVNGAAELTPAGLLDLLNAADALRRPARLETLVEACAAVACSPPGALQDYPPAPLLREALAIVRTVDAGAAARAVGGARSGGITSGSGKSGSAKSGNAKSGNAKSNPAPHGVDVIAKAVRAARLKALRAWRGNRT